MFHTIAAKAVIMVMDTKVSIGTALDTLLGNMPPNLKRTVKKHLTVEVELIIHGEIIDLTEEELLN